MPHNGGLSQAVFWFLTFGGEFPFLNLEKASPTWGTVDNTANILPANFDANGYVHTITNGGVKHSYAVPSQSERPGNYVYKWDGGGTMHRGFTATTVSGSLTSSAGTTNNRCEFSTSATTFITGVSGVATPGGGAGNYPTNFRVCHVDDEALLDAGEMFSVLLKTRLAKIGVLRFLDWQLINTTQLRLWEDQMPEAHYSYGAAYWKYYAGLTTNSGDDYSVTYGSGGPVDGEQIMVTFNATSSGFTPTFNKNGTGAVDIKFMDGRTLAFDVWKPTIGRTGVLTYNLALNAWLKMGGDTEAYDAGFYGVPVSIMLRLCEEVGAHPWLHIPYQAVDPMTNFTTELATACKAYAEANATWMIPRYEPINEVWNSAGGFPCTRLANALENVRVGSATDDYHNWYGRVLSKVGKAVSAVYADDRTKYQVICGVQTYGSTASSANRMASARYVTETGQAGDAAKFWATRVAFANYWHSSFAGTATEATMATEYATASTSRKAALLAEYLESNAGSNAFDMEGSLTQAGIWTTWAATFTGVGSTLYEGGYDYGYSEGSDDLQTFTRAAYFSPALKRQTQYQYQKLVSLGAEFPSLYTLAGASDWGYGGVGESIYQATPSAQWDGIVDYNLGKRSFYLQCT